RVHRAEHSEQRTERPARQFLQFCFHVLFFLSVFRNQESDKATETPLASRPLPFLALYCCF
ncbi:hypothetical protein, partial [Fibrobacter sp.]|uniref:hypothetical protein n=1 Tax=Fibrobacter sp. TaxID=35828 RepID=UPI00388CF539